MNPYKRKDRMGEILTRQVRPAEFVETVKFDTAGKEVSRETAQVAPAVYHVVDTEGVKIPAWVWIVGGGVALWAIFGGRD